MSCEEYLQNLSNLNIGIKDSPPEKVTYETMRYVTNEIILPVIFAFGIVGNIFNLIVLTRKRFRGRMNLMEKSATLGLFGLAISDLLFCLVGFPYVFIMRYTETKFGDSTATLMMAYYENYYPAILNTFLLISTWIVVYVSVERYIGVCYPFKAREIVSLTRTTLALVIIYVISAAINIPNFMKYSLVKTQCAEDCACYYKELAGLFRGDFPLFYHILWGIFGTFVPLLILVYCNASISWTILKRRGQEGAHFNRNTLDSVMRATSILLSIVLMYLVLVCPSMALKFLQRFLPPSHGLAYRFVYNMFLK